MTYSFTGPSLLDLAWRPIAGCIIGGYLGVVSQSSVALFGLAAAVHEIADILFYQIAHAFQVPQDGGRRDAKLYMLTSLTSHILTAAFLYQSNLIGRLGLRIFSGLIAVDLLCKYTDLPKYKTIPLSV